MSIFLENLLFYTLIKRKKKRKTIIKQKMIFLLNPPNIPAKIKGDARIPRKINVIRTSSDIQILS